MAHQKQGTEAHHTTSRYAEIIARWVIGIYSIATILTLFTWIISPLRRGHGFTWWEITASLLNIPSSHTLVSAVIMVVMTSALITRKRAALYAVIFFQVIGILIGTRSALLLFFPDNVMPSEEFFSSTLDTVAIIVAAIFYSASHPGTLCLPGAYRPNFMGIGEHGLPRRANGDNPAGLVFWASRAGGYGSPPAQTGVRAR